jgi:hypothetical protein
MKEFITRKDFLKKARISKSKFYRDKLELTSKYKHFNKPIFKKFGREVKINQILLQEYVDDYWIKIEAKSHKQQSIIDIFKNPNSMEKHLQKYDWKIFATISPKFDWSSEFCRTQMSTLFDSLYSKIDGVKLFWTSEQFVNRTGNHIHFLIEFNNFNDYADVKEILNKTFYGNRLDVQKYDNTKLGVFYISKNGLNDDNWDIYL